MYQRIGKRVLDVGLATIGLLLTSPLLVALTGWLTVVNRGKPFFGQPRPGRNGVVFRMLKFKTMTDQRDQNGKLLSDNERLTKTGHFLRNTSLDELPQFWHVLTGEMSLVGPRPLLVEYMPLYSPEQARRHKVRPGITGWAQVNGRNALSWQQKLAHDVWYVDHVSLTLDTRILWTTMSKVLRSQGINATPLTTMEKFTGTN